MKSSRVTGWSYFYSEWICTVVSIESSYYYCDMVVTLLLYVNTKYSYHYTMGQYVAKQSFYMNEDDAVNSPRPLGLGGIDIEAHNTQIQAEYSCLYEGQ